MRNRKMAGLALALLLLSGISSNTVSAAPAEGLCQRSPRNAVAQLCADVTFNMYGTFTSFRYPVVQHDAGSGEAYNSTRFFTSDTLATSYEFGLAVSWGSPTGNTAYSPYWVDYSAGYEYHALPGFTNTPDDRNHTFMTFPHCDGCRSWDLYYDFNYVATTREGQTPYSHNIVTGWDISATSPGSVGFPLTSNKIQWLNGNQVFSRFGRTGVSTRAPQGDCSPGAHPDYCFRFDTTVGVDGQAAVASWDVAKPVLGMKAANTTPQRVTPMAAEDARAAAVRLTMPKIHAAGKALTADVVTDKDEQGRPVWKVAVRGAVTELTGDRRVHGNGELVFDQADHRLLSARMW